MVEEDFDPQIGVTQDRRGADITSSIDVFLRLIGKKKIKTIYSFTYINLNLEPGFISSFNLKFVGRFEQWGQLFQKPKFSRVKNWVVFFNMEDPNVFLKNAPAIFVQQHQILNFF